MLAEMFIIRKILWDEWNVEHIKKHTVSPKEAELALCDITAVVIEGHSGRLLVLGRANNRLLSIVLAQETESHFYVVTARDMDKKERKIYREENKK